MYFFFEVSQRVVHAVVHASRTRIASTEPSTVMILFTCLRAKSERRRQHTGV